MGSKILISVIFLEYKDCKDQSEEKHMGGSLKSYIFVLCVMQHYKCLD